MPSIQRMEPKYEELLTHQASRWYARLRAPDCNDSERSAFQQWLAVSPLHEEAFHAVVRVADAVKGAMQEDPRLKALADAALSDKASSDTADKESAPTEASGTGGGWKKYCKQVAAVLCGVAVAALLAANMADFSAESDAAVSYANVERHQQRIVLNDGSVMYLDVDAIVTVRMSDAARRLELTQGRAYFEVAHDALRPFSVTAIGTRTVALGTRFEVSIHDAQVNVTLAQGSVAVDSERDGWREILEPGQQLFVDEARRQRDKRSVDTAAVTSWSSGRLVFNGMPLQQVLDEINRYAMVKVRLGDEHLAGIPIGGNFQAGGDSSEFVDTLAAVLQIRGVRTGANEIVLFESHTDNQL